MSGENETGFQFLAEHSVDIICRVGLDLALHYASPSTFRVLGWKPEEMIGKVAKDFILAEDMPVFAAAIVRIFSPGVQTETATVRMRKKDGSTAWMEMNARLVRDSRTVMRDITERKVWEERLSALALTDGLTGLSNRRAFDEALDREWKRMLPEGSQISLLLLDIDHFKDFNDQYGHQVGDDCLRAVAAAMEADLPRRNHFRQMLF